MHFKPLEYHLECSKCSKYVNFYSEVPRYFYVPFKMHGYFSYFSYFYKDHIVNINKWKPQIGVGRACRGSSTTHRQLLQTERQALFIPKQEDVFLPY